MNEQFSGTKEVAENLAFSLDALNQYLEKKIPNIGMKHYNNKKYARLTSNKASFSRVLRNRDFTLTIFNIIVEE